MYGFYSDMQYSCIFGELEFEPDAIFKFMLLLCKSQLKENESQVAYSFVHVS
jgi:hypothetical protein